VTRWIVGTLAALVLSGIGLVSLARALGWSGSRLSVLVSVLAQWLAAWLVWGVAGHLAVTAGLLDRYEPALFAAIGLFAGLWQYRAAVGAARERARVVFVGAQLLWLVIVLAQNGVFR
jgi:hypothetical protein